MRRWAVRAFWAVLVTQTLAVACVINLVSLSYLYFFPDDPLNLSPVHGYLLTVNSYAFGTVLHKFFIKPRRQYVSSDTYAESDNEPQNGPRCLRKLVLLNGNGSPN
jgi:hypothetical protein